MNYVLAAASILGLSFFIAQGVTQVTVRKVDNITFTQQKNDSAIICGSYSQWRESYKKLKGQYPEPTGMERICNS